MKIGGAHTVKRMIMGDEVTGKWRKLHAGSATT
jgi:hypothetical protein